MRKSSGWRRGPTKLSDAQARAGHAMVRGGWTVKHVAAKFRVSEQVIRELAQGTTYKHLGLGRLVLAMGGVLPDPSTVGDRRAAQMRELEKFFGERRSTRSSRGGGHR